MTKPNHEAVASANLQRQGFEHYCPRFLEGKNIRPLFPRYLFILIDTSWYVLRSTRGISRVLLGDTGPQVLSESVICELKMREDKNGLVSLIDPPKFSPGDTVKAVSGPFEGLLCIYEGMSSHERVWVLFNVLGRRTRVEVEEKNLVAA